MWQCMMSTWPAFMSIGTPSSSPVSILITRAPASSLKFSPSTFAPFEAEDWYSPPSSRGRWPARCEPGKRQTGPLSSSTSSSASRVLSVLYGCRWPLCSHFV